MKPRKILQIVLNEVCDDYGVSEAQLIAPGRTHTEARYVTAYFISTLTVYSGDEIGDLFGRISNSITSRSHSYVRNKCKYSLAFSQRIVRLRKAIFQTNQIK